MNGKRVDDGALLIIAKNDQRMRIEVGYGLEGVLTDAMSNRIISETITPAFREGNFYGGIDGGLDQMMKLIEGEALPPPEHAWQSGRRGARPALSPAAAVRGAGRLGRAARASSAARSGRAFTGAGAGALV